MADAVREGHLQIAELIRSKGGELLFDVAKASADLCEYARQGDVRHVKMLLACGLDVNVADYDRRTCMHLAAATGNTNVVEALIAQGANLNVADRWGGTPLGDAIREGHAKLADLIRSKGGKETV